MSGAAFLYDNKGNPYGVSGGMSLPTGAIGQLLAAVDPSGFVRYLMTTSGSLQVTGSVGISGITFPEAITVAGTVAVSNFPAQVFVVQQGTVGVSGSVSVAGQVSVNNFPATQNVSGSVTLAGYASGLTGSTYITSTGSLPVAVVGTVTVSLASQPPGQVFTSGPQGVTGSVNVYTSGPQAVSGTVTVFNPAPVGVTGSVSVLGQISIDNFPATQNVSGSVSISSLPPGQVFTSGPQGVTGSVSVYTSGPQLVSGTVTVFNPATVGISGSVSVAGQVSVNNFPATQNVSGSVSVSYQANVTGSTYVTTTGSLPVIVVGTVPVTLASQVSVSNFPAVQAVSGSVSVLNFPAQVFVVQQGTVGVSGSVSVLGQVSVDNFPATQNVSGSVTVGAWGLNVTGSVALAGPGSSATSPLWVTGSTGTGGGGSGGSVTQGTTPWTVAGSANVYTSGPQAVSGSVFVTVSGSTGLAVAAPPGAPLWVTGSTGTNDTSVTGSLSPGSNPLAIGLSGQATVAFQLSGIFTGSYAYQASVDGVVWSSVNASVLIGTPNYGLGSQGASAALGAGIGGATGLSPANTGIGVVDVAGYSQFRISSSLTAPSLLSVLMRASTAPGPGMVMLSQLPAGSNNIGSVTVSGQVSVNNFPATLSVSGSSTGPLWVTTTGSLPVMAFPVVSTTVTGTIYSGSTSSRTLANVNAGRLNFMIYNDDNSPSDAFIYFGSSAAAPTVYSMRINPGGLYEPNGGFIYTGQIDFTWDGTSGSLYYTEFTR